MERSTNGSAVKVGDYIVISGRPCKVVDKWMAKGHKKYTVKAIDLGTGRTLHDVCAPTQEMRVPVMETKNYSLWGITDDGFLSLWRHGHSNRGGCSRRTRTHRDDSFRHWY